MNPFNPIGGSNFNQQFQQQVQQQQQARREAAGAYYWTQKQKEQQRLQRQNRRVDRGRRELSQRRTQPSMRAHQQFELLSESVEVEKERGGCARVVGCATRLFVLAGFAYLGITILSNM
jgi:hypothetical protein